MLVSCWYKNLTFSFARACFYVYCRLLV